jgi:hypothetical protein
MRRLVTIISDLSGPVNVEPIVSARYGVIETADGQFRRLRLRALPKLISFTEIVPLGNHYHCRGPEDRCFLYYNQPRRFPNFLAVKYVVSTRGTSYGTFRAALDALDEIARLKRTDALLCDIANTRISDRLMARWGWEPHKPQWLHRNFIKRFYGKYPQSSKQL